MLLACQRSTTPTIEATRHIGTIRMTASGRVRLSNCAASTRNTNTTANTKQKTDALPLRHPWRGAAGEFGGRIKVVTRHPVGSGNIAHRSKRAERYSFTAGIADPDIEDVAGIHTEWAVDRKRVEEGK